MQHRIEPGNNKFQQFINLQDKLLMLCSGCKLTRPEVSKLPDLRLPSQCCDIVADRAMFRFQKYSIDALAD